MSKLTKEYKVTEDLIVCPNGDSYKEEYNSGEIFIKRKEVDNFITLSISEAKEIINVLQEIIDAVEREPVIGDVVTILEGRFKGMTGRIYDIDKMATERELIVKMDKTKDCDSFYAYIDKDNVE